LISSSVNTLLEVHVIFVVKLQELGVILSGHLVEEFQDSVGQDTPELADQVAVLQQLSGQIQRNVLAVDNTLDKSQPSGQNLVSLGENQYLLAVQAHANVTLLAYVHNGFKNLIKFITKAENVRSTKKNPYLAL
jgi:hypothetical protein